MRLLIRYDGGVGPVIDLDLDLVEDATVGDVADHLARISGSSLGLTIEGMRRDARVSDGGLLSGSTVRLCEEGPASDARDTRESTLAPVAVTLLREENQDRQTAPAPRILSYGSNTVGSFEIHVSDTVEVRADGSAIPLVNGNRVRGSRRLSDGDIVTDCNWKSDSFAVSISGELAAPSQCGPAVQHRLTTKQPSFADSRVISLPTPPDRSRLPGFPLLSAVVPLLMGAGLWVATRSVASALFILFSFVYVVASGLEARHEARAEQKFRVSEFRVAVNESVETLNRLQLEEKVRLERELPDVSTLTAAVAGRDEIVWERSIALDPATESAPSPLRVRVGIGEVVTATRLGLPTSGRGELLRELEDLCRTRSRAELPVPVDLAGDLAIIGTSERTTDLARWTVVQLASLLAPDELSIKVLCSDGRRSSWDWSKWLPHCHSNTASPRNLIVVDGAERSLIRSTIAVIGDHSSHLLWLSSTRAAVPTRIRNHLHLGVSARLVVSPAVPTAPDGVVADNIRICDMTEDEALPIARSLASMTPVRSPLDEREASSFKGDSSLRSVVAEPSLIVDPHAVAKQWAASRKSHELSAPVGRARHGVLHFDLRNDGPHALIAGTTGAGKSEFLRTLVASISLHHGPDKVTFLLIDYKGGAAFRTLNELPHTVGLVTDLDENLASRALTSLRAEVRMREEILGRLGLNDLGDAEPPIDVPPALFVVVDEFATLARELPAFVDGLVDVAQRGRSLGVHLLLATQRPAGVVTDSIRANSSLRIALRVADEDDSRDVVDSPDAATLPRGVPGSALVRVGSDRPIRVNFAYSGAPAVMPQRVTSRPFSLLADRNSPSPASEQEPLSIKAPSELDKSVETIRTAAELLRMKPPRRPWVQPLPERLDLDDLESPVGPGSGSCVTANASTVETSEFSDMRCGGQDLLAIGLVDRPAQQRRDLLYLDLEHDGGVLIIGPAGSGRTTACATVAAALTRSERPGAAYAIGRNSLRALAGRAGIADVIDPTDGERVLRLLREANRRIDNNTRDNARDSQSPVDRLLIIVDDYVALEESHERLNRGEALELISRIARTGRTAGVHLAISARRLHDLPVGLAASLGSHIQLHFSPEDDLETSRVSSRDLPPGRGAVGADEIQIASPERVEVREVLEPPIAGLPTQVKMGALGVVRREWSSLPIGLSADSMEVATIDLSHAHALITGPRRSGRTAALDTLASAFTSAIATSSKEAGTPAAYLISRAGASILTPWTQRLELGWGADADSLGEFADLISAGAQSGSPTLVAVDDLPDLLEGSLGDELESALCTLAEMGERYPIRFALSGEIEAISRAFSPTLSKVRSGRTGVILQADPDIHGSLLHVDLPRRDEIPTSAGRGWILNDARPALAQLALVE